MAIRNGGEQYENFYTLANEILYVKKIYDFIIIITYYLLFIRYLLFINAVSMYKIRARR